MELTLKSKIPIDGLRITSVTTKTLRWGHLGSESGQSLWDLLHDDTGVVGAQVGADPEEQLDVLMADVAQRGCLHQDAVRGLLVL